MAKVGGEWWTQKGEQVGCKSHDKVDTLCVWPETTALGQKMQKAMQENAENSHANIQSFDFVWKVEVILK